MVFTICFHKEILQNLQLWFWSKLKFTNNLWTNKVETILSCPTYPCFSKPRDSKYALPSCCRCMALCFEKKAKPSQEPSCFQRTCWTFPLPLGFPLLFFPLVWYHRPRNWCPLPFVTKSSHIRLNHWYWVLVVFTDIIFWCLMVAVVPYFFDIRRHYYFSCVGKKCLDLSFLQNLWTFRLPWQG